MILNLICDILLAVSRRFSPFLAVSCRFSPGVVLGEYPPPPAIFRV